MRRRSRWGVSWPASRPGWPEACCLLWKLCCCCCSGHLLRCYQHCALSLASRLLALGLRLQEFYTDLKDAEREGEVNRILGAFKLNPYEQLNLHHDATPEDVRRQYRKVGGWGRVAAACPARWLGAGRAQSLERQHWWLPALATKQHAAAPHAPEEPPSHQPPPACRCP